MKIIIKEDSNTEMLSIQTEAKILFYGNYWDFERCGESFKQILESVGADVELIEENYDEW